MSNEFGLYLGPLFGFLFTTGTLLFIVFNAHRTAKAEAGAAAASAPAETPTASAPAEQTETHS